MNDQIPERGMIERWLAKIFGASWSTALSGYITMFSFIIHEKPTIIHWIPEPFQGIIWNVSEWLFVGGIGAIALRAKDKNVTGGSRQQTVEGKLAAEGTQNIVDLTVQATEETQESKPK